MKKNLFNIFMLYACMLILGLLLWVILIPVVNATREEFTIWGGECLMPLYTLGITAVVRTIRKERKE